MNVETTMLETTMPLSRRGRPRLDQRTRIQLKTPRVLGDAVREIAEREDRPLVNVARLLLEIGLRAHRAGEPLVRPRNEQSAA